MIVLILVFLLGGLWETEAMSVTGVLGEEVTIKCSHSNAFSNVKYFCREACGNEDVLISSRTNKMNSNGKYSIIDEGNTFRVTISYLTKEDSGSYYCGIERIGVDTYNGVILTVTDRTANDLSQSNASSTKRLVYSGVGLGVVVLALAMTLLIFFRYRKRGIHTSSGNDNNTVYAAHSSQNQDGHHITTSSSTANGDKETDSRSLSSSTVQHKDTRGDRSDNIYSNVAVSSEPQTQPDGLFYSTVSFNRRTENSDDAPRSAALTYSTIKHKE